MKRIGITGPHGFIGYHLSQSIRLSPDEFSLLKCDRRSFHDAASMDAFVSACDVIVHLAGVNRHADPQELYNENVNLVDALLASLWRTGCRPHIIHASSIQESQGTIYGESKKLGRERLSAWAGQVGATFTGLLLPNIYGPYGRPFYNSVVATFCHLLSRGEEPVVHVDANLQLLYVGDLVGQLISIIRAGCDVHKLYIEETTDISVSALFALLTNYNSAYLRREEMPALDTPFARRLFTTYQSFTEPLLRGEDIRRPRNAADAANQSHHVEQAAQSAQRLVLAPAMASGDLFHTQKIKRVVLEHGCARIAMRRVGTEKITELRCDSTGPTTLDIPVWNTYQVVNIGTGPLSLTLYDIVDCGFAGEDTWNQPVSVSQDSCCPVNDTKSV
jgi:UDP-2-acetamido-2,6-beta-L-arabino-hexul-4-ose reductase